MIRPAVQVLVEQHGSPHRDAELAALDQSVWGRRAHNPGRAAAWAAWAIAAAPDQAAVRLDLDLQHLAVRGAGEWLLGLDLRQSHLGAQTQRSLDRVLLQLEHEPLVAGRLLQLPRCRPIVLGLQYRASSTGPPSPTGCAPAWSASQPPRQTAPCSSRLSPRSHPPQSPALPWQRTVRENARCVQRFKRGQSTKVRAHYLERRLAVPHRVFRLLELGERAGAGKAGRGGQSGQKQSFDAVAPTGGVTMRWTHGNQALLGLRAGRLIILAPDRACYRCPKSNARSSL